MIKTYKIEAFADYHELRYTVKVDGEECVDFDPAEWLIHLDGKLHGFTVSGIGKQRASGHGEGFEYYSDAVFVIDIDGTKLHAPLEVEAIRIGK